MSAEEQEPGRDLTAGDAKEAAGLTYRQLNDWDEKGVLPENESREARWRRFSPREIFALMVCSAIRKEYGVPLKSLKWLSDYMLQEGANHFEAAVQIIS